MAKRAVVHNEYFRSVRLGGRRSCPCCHSKLRSGEQIWSWGEYVRGKWYTVQHFCQQCWGEVENRLQGHAFQCRCSFQLVGYGGEQLPAWLSLEPACCATGSN
jgi:hypothetical protein